MCNLKGCETGKTGLDSSITRKRVGHSTKIVLSFAPDPVRYCPLASAPTIPFQGFQLVPPSHNFTRKLEPEFAPFIIASYLLLLAPVCTIVSARGSRGILMVIRPKREGGRDGKKEV